MKLLQEIKVPQESVNDELVTVVDIIYKDGEFVEEDDIVIELESSKALFTIESEVAGYIKYYCKIEDEVEVNSTIIKIFDEISDNLYVSEEKSDNKKETDVILETVFSEKAEQYIIENKIDKLKFKHLDFVSTEDIYSTLGINKEEKTNLQQANSKNIQLEKLIPIK